MDCGAARRLGLLARLAGWQTDAVTSLEFWPFRRRLLAPGTLTNADEICTRLTHLSPDTDEDFGDLRIQPSCLLSAAYLCGRAEVAQASRRMKYERGQRIMDMTFENPVV